MRKWIPLLLVALAAALSVNVAGAQTQARPVPKDAKPVDDVPPPPRVKEDGDAKAAATAKANAKSQEPIVTARTEGDKRIEEFRVNGKLYKMKVTPANGPSYYLIDEKGEGNFNRVDGPEPKITVPKWVLFEW